MSDFCCSCDTYSYPYREELRRAAKTHKCSECGFSIQAGDKYTYVTGKCEGDWFSVRRCRHCTAVVEFVTAHVPCFCYEHSNLYGQLSGSLDDSNLGSCVAQMGREVPGLAFAAMRLIVSAERGRRRSRNNGFAG